MTSAELTAVQALNPQRSVEAQVVDLLRELIVSGTLSGGTRLTQRDLAERLQVSQTPVRAGLSLLEREGLVTIQGKGRALVRHLTREDGEELYAMRRGLEGLAARLGAQVIDDERIAEMRALLKKLRAAAKRADVKEYLQHRWTFHAVCYKATGRSRLVKEVERLYWRSERYTRLLLSTQERFTHSLGWYEQFLACCEAHDGAGAEQVIDASTRWGILELAPLLPSEEDIYPS